VLGPLLGGLCGCGDREVVASARVDLSRNMRRYPRFKRDYLNRTLRREAEENPQVPA
jgi:hypothetical protein